jgi:hypothetical protein
MTTSEGTTAAAAEPATPDAATIVADDIAAVIWVRERLWRPLEPADQAKLQHLALRLVRADTSEVLRFWGLLAQAVLAYHYRDLKTAFPNALAARDIAVWHYRSGGLLKPEPGIAAMAPATAKAAIGIGADPTWAVLSTCLVADIHRLTQDERGTERELDRAGRFAERHPMLEALVTLYEGRNMLLHGDPGCAAGGSRPRFSSSTAPPSQSTRTGWPMPGPTTSWASSRKPATATKIRGSAPPTSSGTSATTASTGSASPPPSTACASTPPVRRTIRSRPPCGCNQVDSI